MAVDILSVNALHRKTANNRKERKVQLALRDSAIEAQGATQTYIDSWNAVIAGLDSDITNFVGDYDYLDSFHAVWNSASHYDYGNYNAFRYGIKRLCDYGAITSNFAVDNTSGAWGQCGSSCSFTVPAGVSRLGVTGTAPGGPGKMGNCCAHHYGGPYGSFISMILCVTPGDSLIFCSGCSYCCMPYCCNYDLYQSCPSYICSVSGSLGASQLVVCMSSPHPYGCVETRNRLFENIEQCGGIPGTSGCCGPTCYASCQGGLAGGGCCCFTFYFDGQCLCNECGHTICHPGNNGGCVIFGCMSQNYTMSQVGCLNGARFQRDLYGDTGQCTLCDMTRYRCPIVTGTGIDAKIVQGSCFPWMGGWPGGWACNNCHKANLINHPYALAVGLTSTDCHCSLCWSQCCSGCCGASCQSQRCFPGYGASAMLTCGGYTAMYQDLGRRGAWCVQYC